MWSLCELVTGGLLSVPVTTLGFNVPDSLMNLLSAEQLSPPLITLHAAVPVGRPSPPAAFRHTLNCTLPLAPGQQIWVCVCDCWSWTWERGLEKGRKSNGRSLVRVREELVSVRDVRRLLLPSPLVHGQSRWSSPCLFTTETQTAMTFRDVCINSQKTPFQQ